MKHFGLHFLAFVLLFSNYVLNGQSRFIIPDSSFGTAGYVINPQPGNYTESVYSMDIQADGKIVIGGATGNAGRQATIIRFLSTGIPDNTFGNQGYVYLPYVGNIGNSAGGIKVLPNGKIIANGSNDSSAFIVRLNADGLVDSTFGTKGFTTFLHRQSCRCPAPLQVLQDGSIISQFQQGSGPYTTVLIKTDGNGIMDNSFGTAGELVVNDITYNGRLVLDKNNRILVYGNNTYYVMGVVRLLANGTRDNSFGVNGLATVAAIDSAASSYGKFYFHPTLIVLPDNSIIMAADNGAPLLSTAAVHVLSNGIQDMSYGTKGLAYTGFKFANPVCGVAFDNNEVLMMGLNLYTAGPQIFTGQLSVLNTGGKIDSLALGGNAYTSFQYETGAANKLTTPVAMCFLPGGKIMAAGQTSSNIWLARYKYGGFAAGINENNLSMHLQLFPNPSGNFTTLSYHNKDGKESSIKVFDLTGKLVLEKLLPAGQEYLRIETSGWYDGIYFIQLHTDNQVITAKLIVEH